MKYFNLKTYTIGLALFVGFSPRTALSQSPVVPPVPPVTATPAKPATAQSASPATHKAATPASSLSPEALVDRAIAAAGGEKALQETEEHAILEGDMEMRKPFANQMHMTMYHKAGKTRVDFANGLLTGTVVITKEGGWKSALGSVSDLSREEIEQQRQGEQHRESLLTKIKNGDFMLRALGRRKLPDGFLADGVRATPKSGAFTDFYFDPKTGKLAAMGYRGKNALTGTDVDSIQRTIPGKKDGSGAESLIGGEMRTYEDGELAQTIKISRMDSKAEIPDTLFERPGATQADMTAAVTVPFDFSSGELVVNATINGKSGKLMVDTGAGITILLPKAAKQLGLKPSGKANLGGGGGAAAAQFATVNSLQVGTATIKNLNIGVIDVGALSAVIGTDIDGVLGYNFLSQYQVTLDYGTRQMTLAPKSAPLPTDVKPIALDIFNNVPMVDAVSGGKKFRMMLDTGAMWTILPSRVAPTLRFARVQAGAMAMGVDGSPVRLQTARLADLTLGEQNVGGTLVSFAPPAKKMTGALLTDFANGILGNTFLRRFRVTLDYAKQKLVLAPLTNGDPYPDEWTNPGVTLAKFTPKAKAIIAQIMEKSPASQTDLMLLETVEAVDGKPTAGMTNPMLAQALRGPEGSTVQLTVTRHGKLKTLKLKRAKLL